MHAPPLRPGIAFACLAVLGVESVTIARNAPQLWQADFLALWTAARAVRAGLLDRLPDAVAFRPVQSALIGHPLEGLHPWLYPPTTLLAVWPLALLPYGAAFFAWTAGTAALYATAIRRAFPASRIAVLAALASPAAFMTAINGQTSFLAAALLAWGLLLLPSRPRLAGVLLGALVVKPQLALLVPVALVAGRCWAALLAAGATAAAIAGAATALLGARTWTAFRTVQVPFAWTLMVDGRIGYHKVQSVFAAVRLAGGGVALASALQTAMAIAAAASVAWIWSRREVRHELKAAAVLGGALLATVYALDYDMVATGVAIALVVGVGLREGWGRLELATVSLAVVVPAVSRLVGEATRVNLGPIALVALQGVVLRRAAHQVIGAGAASQASAPTHGQAA